VITHESPVVANVGQRIAEALADLEPYFVPGVKLTFLARNPAVPDGLSDMVITNDAMDDVIAAMERHKGKA
jgi:hypothetical protein